MQDFFMSKDQCRQFALECYDVIVRDIKEEDKNTCGVIDITTSVEKGKRLNECNRIFLI